MQALSVGIVGTATLVVGTNDTAPKVGSGHIAVLATPVMINLAEEAALNAIEQHLSPGKQSLGTLVNMSHIAATPIGMAVTASATISSIVGRIVEFDVLVSDAHETIGAGQHTRVVVTAERFQARVDEKANR